MAPLSALLETITISLAFSCSQTALTAAQANIEETVDDIVNAYHSILIDAVAE